MAGFTPSYVHVSRHAVFYFRMAIPPALRTSFGAREIKRSLKTRDRRTAIQKARACAVQCEALFARFQDCPMNYREMRALLLDAKDQLLAQLNEHVAVEGPPTMADRREIIEERKRLHACRTSNQYSPAAQEMADRLLATHRIDLAQDSAEYHRFCWETTKMLDALWKAYLQHSHACNDYGATPEPLPAPAERLALSPAPWAPATPTAARVGLREVIDAYCAEKQREEAWTEKTLQEQRAIFDLFIKITGERPLATISVDTARDYKAVLLKLPANLNKNPLYRDKSIAQVLAMKPTDTLAINTVNKNLIRVSALFAWAKKHGYVHENYFDKLTLKKKKRPHEERAAFTEA